MNTDEMEKMLADYFAWMKDNTAVRKIDSSWLEITTPYLDRHNDYLQIFAKKEDGIITLCDDGYTMDDLLTSGCSIESERQKRILKTVLNRFDVTCDNDVLSVETGEQDFAVRKQDLLQAMLSISGMAYLSFPASQNVFLDEVTKWFDSLEIRYICDFKLTGRTGYAYSFDMAIPKSKESPERIIQTVNNPSKDKISNLIFKWNDTKENRKTTSELIAILNNSTSNAYEKSVNALASYEIKSVLWTNREDAKVLLAS